ncbi:hypothetical protein BCON_0169g00140 [Botryotinia convoluta]|uniref:Uncharacterized protein n=1 Tax=Botryotinia convoluta TaxID=54673 RepID=A0A4Z1HPQ0_9HELO|nr:hypothetical protein BCON_0169g00140 [Botryotinia convoluta]
MKRDGFRRGPSGPQFDTFCKASHIRIITTAISSCQSLALFLVAHIFRAKRLWERGDHAEIHVLNLRSASSGSIHSITIKDDTPISNDDKGNSQQQPITNIELSRYYVVNNIYLPENMNNGDNKPSHMYDEGQAQNEIGFERIYTHPQENSFHYIYRPFPGTKNHQAERFDDKHDQFTEFYFPKNPHTPLIYETRGFHEYKTRIFPDFTVPRTSHQNGKAVSASSTPIFKLLPDLECRRNACIDKDTAVHSSSATKPKHPSVLEPNNWNATQKKTIAIQSNKEIDLRRACVFQYDRATAKMKTMTQSGGLTQQEENKAQRTKLPDLACTTSLTHALSNIRSFVSGKQKQDRMILARHPTVHDEPKVKHSISQLRPSIDSESINYRSISFIDLAGPLESDNSSNHQSQQLYASDPGSLKPVSTGRCPKREHIVDLTLDSPSRKKPFKRCHVTTNHQIDPAQSQYSTTATYGSHNQNFLSPELKRWMSFNPIKHIVVCSKDSPDISDRIYDVRNTAASISDGIMALLNIKVDHTNIHSVHLKDHKIDSPIPSLGNTNKMHGYSSKSALVFVSTMRSAATGDTILLVSLGNHGISNSPRAWVDLRENYPAYKFLIAIQERRNPSPHPDSLWRITKKRKYLIFPLYQLVRVCLGLESPCDEAKLYSKHLTLSNDARKAPAKAETRIGNGNDVDQHARALLSRWACPINGCGMTWYRSLAGDQAWQTHCTMEHDGFRKLVCPLAACRSSTFRDYKGVVEHIENVHIAALGLRDHYRSSHDRDRTLSSFRCTENVSRCGNSRCSYTNQLALDTHMEFFHPYSAWKDRLKDFPSLAEQVQSKWSKEDLEPNDGLTLSEAFQCIDATVGSQGTVIVGRNGTDQDTSHGMEFLEKSWPFMADFLRATQEPLREGYRILSSKI